MREPLTKKIKWCYALGQFGWSILSGIVIVWLVWFYFPPANVDIAAFIPREAILGALTVIGIITMLGRFMDAITDPLIASMSDASKNPKGRRIPFMAKAAIPFAVVTVLVYFSPVNQTSWVNVLFLTVTLLAYYVLFTLYVTPFYALTAELSHCAADRIDMSTYSALTWFLGYIVASGASFIWPVFVDMGMPLVWAIRTTFIILAGLALIFLFIPVITIDERKLVVATPTDTTPIQAVKDTFKNRNFLVFEIFFLAYNIALTVFQTGNVYYVTVLLEMEESAVTLVTIGSGLMTFACYPAVNILSKKIGKKKLSIVGMICLIFAYFYCSFLGVMPIPKVAQIIIFAIIAGIGLSIFGILPNAIAADIAEADKARTGQSKEGMYYAVQTFMSKLGQMIAMVIFSSLLLLGKDPGNDMGIRLTGVVAAVLGFGALLVFLKFKEEEEV